MNQHMKRFFTLMYALLSAAVFAGAQTGTWSGRLEVQGTSLSIVFHLDGDKPTADSPYQGVTDLPFEV